MLLGEGRDVNLLMGLKTSDYLPASDDPSIGFSVVAGGCLSRSVTPLIICLREASLSWTSLGSSADGSSPVAMCLNFGLVAKEIAELTAGTRQNRLTWRHACSFPWQH